MPETKECKLSFIPKYIRQIINMRPREVVTATRWNELFTLLIEQGDYNTSTIVSIVNEVCELDTATGAQAKSITELYKFIGEMSALQTDEKTNLVEALNEVLNRTIVGTTLQYMTWDTAGVPKAENITPDKIGNDLLICADSATSAKKQFLNTNKELLPRQGNIFPIYFDQGNRVDKITATIYNGVATTQEYPVVTVYGPEIPRMAAKTIVWAGIANGVIQLINPPYPANDTSPLVTIEIEDRGGQNFWTRPVTTAQKIMDMVNVGKEVRLSFFDAIQGTGDQLYTYENTRQGVCYFRRNVVTEDSVSRISWGVQYDGSIVASETPYRGGVLTISTINGVGDPKPKEITTVNLIKYATVGTQTPWYDTEIPAADIAKMSVGQNVRLLVHDKDRNKDLYLLGVVRAVNGNKNCSIEGAGADDGFPLFIDDASARANGTWSSQKINQKIGEKAEINDTSVSSRATWSSRRISNSTTPDPTKEIKLFESTTSGEVSSGALKIPEDGWYYCQIANGHDPGRLLFNTSVNGHKSIYSSWPDAPGRTTSVTPLMRVAKEDNLICEMNATGVKVVYFVPERKES